MTDADPALPAWQDALAACVVGAERAGPLALPPALDGLAAGGGPGGLLATVAALGVWRTAGRVPDAGGAVPLDPVRDALPECGEAAAARLEHLLTSAGADPGPRGEWCRLAAAAGVRAPVGLAPALLKLSRGTVWEGDADRVLGARRQWLSGLDGAAPASGPGVEDWTGPGLPRRVEALRLMRGQDPAAAREALAAAWKGEAADARAKLLAALRVGLGEADEPFLEDRLDDRSAPVRAEAVHLLAGLPGSRYAARMRVRAQAAVRFAKYFAAYRALKVALPEPDEAGARDGLDAAPGEAGPGAARLRRVVGAAPLLSWSSHPPAAWLSAALAGEWGADLLAGWAAAAARARSAPWLTALVDALAAASRRPDFPFRDACDLVSTAAPAAEMERLTTPCLGAPGLEPASFLLQRCRHDWSPAFTAAALAWVARLFGPGAHGGSQASYGLDLTVIARHGDPDAAAAPLAALLAALPEDLRPSGRRQVDALSDTLRLRAGMKQEFAA